MKIETQLLKIDKIDKLVFYSDSNDNVITEITSDQLLKRFMENVKIMDSRLNRGHNYVIFKSNMRIFYSGNIYEYYVTVNKFSVEDLYIGLPKHGTVLRIPGFGEKIMELVPEGR